MKMLSLAGLISVGLVACAAAQTALNNDAIEKMVRARVGDDVIISMIQTQAGNYDLTADTMIAMKEAGVSNKVLTALAARGGTTGTGVLMPSASQTPPVYEDFDIGVYRNVRQAWIPVPSELVDWKGGGVLKGLLPQGTKKRDVNGRLEGGSSTTRLTPPFEFLIKTAKGIDATDFQLVQLHNRNDGREFRTVAGGILHGPDGARSDRIVFEQTQVARWTYRIALPSDLPPGDYAFLAPRLPNSL